MYTYVGEEVETWFCDYASFFVCLLVQRFEHSGRRPPEGERQARGRPRNVEALLLCCRGGSSGQETGEGSRHSPGDGTAREGRKATAGRDERSAGISFSNCHLLPSV